MNEAVETQESEYKPLGTASYSPEDNKIRIDPLHRLDAETYARVKAAGYSWAPRQKIFVAPMWRSLRCRMTPSLHKAPACASCS